MARILIIEDDEGLNSSVCAYFEANGYETQACFNGLDGLKSVEEKDFDNTIEHSQKITEKNKKRNKLSYRLFAGVFNLISPFM